jgi:hypothetical protein
MFCMREMLDVFLTILVLCFNFMNVHLMMTFETGCVEQQ